MLEELFAKPTRTTRTAFIPRATSVPTSQLLGLAANSAVAATVDNHPLNTDLVNRTDFQGCPVVDDFGVITDSRTIPGALEGILPFDTGDGPDELHDFRFNTDGPFTVDVLCAVPDVGEKPFVHDITGNWVNFGCEQGQVGTDVFAGLHPLDAGRHAVRVNVPFHGGAAGHELNVAAGARCPTCHCLSVSASRGRRRSVGTPGPLQNRLNLLSARAGRRRISRAACAAGRRLNLRHRC